MKPFDIVVLIVVPLVIAIGQTLFKTVSTSAPEVRSLSAVLGLFADWRLWLALVLYGLATIAWVVAIRRIPINQAYLFMALTYIYLPLISWLTLGERMSAAQWGGLALILGGLYISTAALKI
jgi:undecaprenyl phosphate-alpha-L-ara4N flippase subunit ArnE